MSYKEIHKLHALLEEANIPHDFRKLYDGYSLRYPQYIRCKCSIIEHLYSYGSEEDMLEISGLLTKEERQLDSVVGFLTAEDVFERIKKDYEEGTNETN